jgi:hypothetical protein
MKSRIFVVVFAVTAIFILSACVRKVEKRYNIAVAEEIIRLDTAGLAKNYNAKEIDSYFSNMSRATKNMTPNLKKMELGKAYDDFLFLNAIKTLKGDYLIIDCHPMVGSWEDFMKTPLDKRMVGVALLDSSSWNIVAKKIATGDSFLRFLKGKVEEQFYAVYRDYYSQLHNAR